MGTAAAANPSGAERDYAFPRDVVEVCSRGQRELLLCVGTAMRLASRAFGPVQDVFAEVDVDPDTEERRAVVNVIADLPLRKMLDRYREYIRQWVGAAPADVREQVRLS